jgi:hypothetical protein
MTAVKINFMSGENDPANHYEAVVMPIARAGAQPEKEVAQAVEK